MTFRNEFWDDPDGYRSGYGSAYYETSVGINWSPTRLIVIRPEVRFDHAFKQNGLASSSAAFNTTGAPATFDGAYDNGTRQSQVTFGIDLTYHF